MSVLSNGEYRAEITEIRQGITPFGEMAPKFSLSIQNDGGEQIFARTVFVAGMEALWRIDGCEDIEAFPYVFDAPLRVTVVVQGDIPRYVDSLASRVFVWPVPRPIEACSAPDSGLESATENS